MENTGTFNWRRKIELSSGGDSSFSFTIVDSLCNSEEESPQERNSVMYIGSNLNSSSLSRPYSESCSSDDFIEICLNSDKKEKLLAETLGEDDNVDISFGCEPVPLSYGIDLVERDAAHNPHNSVSARIEAPHSPCSSESDSFSSTNSRTRFTLRKMFDPFVKPKSPQSRLGYVTEADNIKTSLMENTRRNKTVRKSLLHEFSRSPRNAKLGSDFDEKDSVHSPVHLHGYLKLGAKHGVPSFEFSMNEPEDIFLAKTLKAENAFNWVYTFHSVGNKKKSNACTREPSDSSKVAASIVAQMQVSCHLCSEIKDGGDVEKSMVTEFVLYDTTRARHHVPALGSTDVHKAPTCFSPGSASSCYNLDDGSTMVRLKDHLNHAMDSDEVEFLNGTPADLHPNLEVAAIVIQVPFKDRESLRYRRGGKFNDERHLDLLNVSTIEERKCKIQDSMSQEKVKVIIPTGNHGFPCAKTRVPSSLLDRWRLGGGCDCGGWDMACPLVVFGNPGLNCFQDQPLVASKQPFELFLQGAKENSPALNMTAVDGGYAVDFHANLSALQAFSVCVAVLHCTETSATVWETQTKRLPHYNSLKLLIEEEDRLLIKAATEEKKMDSKKVEVIPPSYVINPPFSPIARV
ncbi:hypothetical protein V6N13_109711 [Hibiscus sabdariffa]|uniref:Uncharacterized protein n=1 Tax=Hibiscus sabdariffa TaxID=183260 RepID=A0ABR2FQN8_9ROSI